ncbi:hypothetical protein, partial [Nocardiopsis halotolerans]|uniref:hypothetical protein n=1 Tax=Nocardiopsis halotolerans TaxID=124252 RepID=UPI001268B4C1
MTRDDREDARRVDEGEDAPRRRSGGPVPGAGPRLGGLLDGLPESGRGARAQPPRVPAGNPFRQPPSQPPPP